MRTARSLTISPSMLCFGGVSAPRGGRGGCLGGGYLLPGGVCYGGVLVLGGGIPACTEADPPVNRMTNRCKNITLP